MSLEERDGSILDHRPPLTPQVPSVSRVLWTLGGAGEPGWNPHTHWENKQTPDRKAGTLNRSFRLLDPGGSPSEPGPAPGFLLWQVEGVRLGFRRYSSAFFSSFFRGGVGGACLAGADSVLLDHLVFLVGLQPGFDPCAGRTFGGTFLGASDWLMGSE